MRFVALSVVAIAGFAASAPSLLRNAKREWTALEGDVADIGDDVVAVHDALAAFNETSGYFDALAIDSKAQTLLQALNTATNEAKNTPTLDATQTSFGLAFLNDLVPEIVDTLNLFIAKKPLFENLLVAGIAKADNGALNNGSDAFADALLAIADPSGTAQGQQIKATLDAAFANSTAAYASD